MNAGKLDLEDGGTTASPRGELTARPGAGRFAAGPSRAHPACGQGRLGDPDEQHDEGQQIQDLGQGVGEEDDREIEVIGDVEDLGQRVEREPFCDALSSISPRRAS